MSENKSLYTEDGTQIPFLDKSPETYLDLNTLIFGPSKTGKTVLIEEILYICRNYIPNYLVIVPETSDKVYRDVLPSRCIKHDLTKDKLLKLWLRQKNITQLYNIANDQDVLRSVFAKIQDRDAIVKIQLISDAAARAINAMDQGNYDFGQKRAQKNLIEELKNKKIISIYRKTIREHKTALLKSDLSSTQQVAVEYLDVNPRLMLIIDDCSEKIKIWMKMFPKNEDHPLESIFYRGRHNYITIVFAAHDDKLVETEFRKNARQTIFTTSATLMGYINRQQSGFTNQEKKEITKIAARVFASDHASLIKTHQKLCYVREDNIKFKYTIANRYSEFRAGCDSLLDLSNKMPKTTDALENNPFISEIIHDKKSKPVIFNKSITSDFQI